jgi:hypothetical protein
MDEKDDDSFDDDIMKEYTWSNSFEITGISSSQQSGPNPLDIDGSAEQFCTALTAFRHMKFNPTQFSNRGGNDFDPFALLSYCPLEWYQMQLAIATQQNNKPLANLLRFAETVLFANSASTMCERVVSCAGVVLTDKRTCLKPERVEKLVYCRMNRCYWEMKKRELGEGKVQAQVESYLENKVGLDEQILSAYEDRFVERLAVERENLKAYSEVIQASTSESDIYRLREIVSELILMQSTLLTFDDRVFTLSELDHTTATSSSGGGDACKELVEFYNKIGETIVNTQKAIP